MLYSPNNFKLKPRRPFLLLRSITVVSMQVLAPTSLEPTDVRVILDTVDRTATSILMNASLHLADMVSETFKGSAKLNLN